MFSVVKPPSPAASDGEPVPASANRSSSSSSDPADNRPSSVSPVPPSAYHFSGPRDAAPSRTSRHSEGYPSWLPRRPPPPAPASTIGTSTPAPFDPEYFANNDEDLDLDAELRHLDTQYGVAARDDDDESPVAPNPLLLGSGRRPTPRSVRIVNLETSITEEPRQVSEGPRPTFATSYGHWKTRAKQRQNRVSSGSTSVAHPSSAVVAGGVPRGWTRGTAPPTIFNSVASNLYSQDSQVESRPRPRFNTRGLHLELLRSPSLWMKVYYRLWPILNLAHVPLQTFLDFNAAYMLIQVSKFPLPNAGPSSSKNWALGAAAYLASWLTWILIIFVVYELVYSFARRWRVRRPLIFQIYISNPAYTYACMSSFNTFCFFQHLRWTAFVPIAPELDGIASSSSATTPRTSGDHQGEAIHEMAERRHHGRNDSTSSDGSAHEEDPALGRRNDPNHPVKFTGQPLQTTLRKRIRRAMRTWKQVTWKDGLAETFNLYAQNVPTVVTLLPRAGLALALLLSFSPGIVGGRDVLVSRSSRDSTFFRSRDGLLTSYAQGVLWANVAWTAWRLCVLWLSWIGLWILSGHSCAGICGPRDKWEEEELNRLSASLARARRTPYSGSASANADETKENTDMNAAIGLGAGRKIQHQRFASSWSNNSNGSSMDADDDILPWEWRECTRARVQDAWEFCVVGDGGRLRWGAGGVPTQGVAEKRPKTPPNEKRQSDGTGLDEEGLQRVLAAVGFGSPNVPTPARRGVLRSDLFQSPTKRSSGSTGRGSPSEGPAAMLSEGPDDDDEMGERRSLPPLQYPYPFTKPGSGYVSSKEEGLVPFPKGEAPGSKGGSKKTSKTGSKSASSSEHDLNAHPAEAQRGDADSSSHNYSSEPSTTTSSASSVHNPRATGSQSNSLSSLGQPIPPTSPAFVSAGMRPLTLSGGTGYSHVTTSHRHSSLGSVMTSTSGGIDPNTSGTSGGLGSISANVAEISPTSVRTGSTRFPFLSGPPSSNSPVPVQQVTGMGIGMGPSLHYGVHGRRVVVQHTGGNQSSMNTSTSGSAYGHGRGHRRGLSHTSGFSSALGSDPGYAASGSAEGDVDAEGVVVDEFGRVRGRASLSQSSGESAQSGESLGEASAGVIPMPRRHPHAGRTRAGTIPSVVHSASSLSPSASASRNVSGSSGESRAARGIAFPTSDVDTTTAELGMVTGYARGMGMEMLSIEASDSLARRERAGRRGAAAAPWARDGEDDEGERPHHAQEQTEATVRPRRDDNDDDDDDMYVDDEDDLEELDDEAREEREDRVGLLTSSLGASAASLHHHSPRASTVGVDQLGQLMPGESRRSSRRSSTQRRSRESLSAAAVAAANRSRHSSNVRSNRSSLAGSASASPTIMPTSPGGTRRNSLFGSAGAVVRDRASSFGVRVRERAQSLMQSVVGASPTRERTTSEVGGHAAKHRRLGSGDASSILGAVPPLPTQPQSSLLPSALGRSVSGQSQESTGSSEQSGIAPIQSVARDYGQLHPQHPIAEDDAYASSHSRSGSESVSTGENYTFGTPMPFMQPRQRESGELLEAPEREGEEHDNEVEGEHVVPAPRLRTTSMTPSVSSTGDDVFYSPISATPIQSGLTTPVLPGHVPSSFPFQQQPSSSAQQGPDAPWQQRIRQAPERQWSGRSQPAGPSGSADMLSTAAQSFVTAPADAQSTFTTTTGDNSSEAATHTGSWDDRRGSGFVGALLSGTAAARGTGRGRRESGFVERVEGSSFVPNPSGGGLGDGRVA